MENNSLTPEQKAAAVIVSLGAEKASKVYKHLSESEIEKLTIEVAKLGHVPPGKSVWRDNDAGIAGKIVEILKNAAV